jgi:hypothetical protein
VSDYGLHEERGVLMGAEGCLCLRQ